MAVGTGVNCNSCPDFKNNNCDGKAVDCLCRLCPRNLAQCMCVKYCRETESILLFDSNYDSKESQWDLYRD